MCHNILYFGKFVYFIEILKKQKDYYKLRGFFFYLSFLHIFSYVIEVPLVIVPWYKVD